jgi:hypothetical protein
MEVPIWSAIGKVALRSQCDIMISKARRELWPNWSCETSKMQ